MGARIHLPVLGGAVPEAPLTREQLRSRRPRGVRARTVSTKRMTKRELELGKMIADAQLEELGTIARPTTRGECAGGARPCPFVSCAHHLFLDVSERTGAIKLNFPDVEIDGLPATCALDVADRGGQTLEEVGAIMNLTRERIRQIEVKAYAKIHVGLRAYAAETQDDALERGLARAHQQIERDGPPSIDAREAWTVADEFFVPVMVEKGSRVR